MGKIIKKNIAGNDSRLCAVPNKNAHNFKFITNDIRKRKLQISIEIGIAQNRC